MNTAFSLSVSLLGAATLLSNAVENLPDLDCHDTKTLDDSYTAISAASDYISRLAKEINAAVDTVGGASA